MSTVKRSPAADIDQIDAVCKDQEAVTRTKKSPERSNSWEDQVEAKTKEETKDEKNTGEKQDNKRGRYLSLVLYREL